MIKKVITGLTATLIAVTGLNVISTNTDVNAEYIRDIAIQSFVGMV